MHRFITHRIQLFTVALTCLAIGAGASAIATANASGSSTKAARAGRGLRLRALIHRTVEGSFEVATKSGFVSVTVARGSVQSITGQTLTLSEGTRKQTYRTVNLTLPAKLTVRDNHRASTLGQVQSGQRAIVVIGPGRALVLAHTPKPA
jgi:hypothetical protein